MATNFIERFSMEAKVGSKLDTGFMGTTQYHFCNLIEEHYNATRHDMTGVFEAYRYDRNTNEGTHCVLMICEQLIFDSCFNPYDNGSFIENFSQIQTVSQHEFACCNSFPGGYLDLFAAAIPSDLQIIG
ncbi:hypothetical protein F66182_14019, partial [Fusarium sp. NRRL 66182]